MHLADWILFILMFVVAPIVGTYGGQRLEREYRLYRKELDK